MVIHEMGDDLRVTFGLGDPMLKEIYPQLMGCRAVKGLLILMVENNLVNRIVLGLDPLGYQGREVPQEVAETWNNCRLESYQQKDVYKGAHLGNFLNLNKMGFGKTVETVLTAMSWEVRSAVILAPKQVCPQWVEHFQEWWPSKVSEVGLHDMQAPIVVTNYEKLLKPRNMEALRDHRRDVVIFDEIHMLKNRNSKRTIYSKQIPARFHVGLSGTPILKQPDDLWSILNAIDWHYSGKSYWNFVKYFCNVVKGYFGQEIQGVTKNTWRLAILRKILDLVTIRNESVQIAKGKKRINVVVPMERSQGILYRKIKKVVLDELPENCTIANGAVLALRLQQTTSWPGLFEVKDQGAKFSWIETFCTGTDEQIVIFTRFAKTANALKAFLATKKVTSVVYTGKQTTKENDASKKKFIEGKVQVFIATIGAAGTGLDGLQCARLGIMIERDWSPEINEQCEDRLNRKGQTMPVMWYYLECEKTFDKHVGKVNLSKADAIRAVLERDD